MAIAGAAILREALQHDLFDTGASNGAVIT
jgi:hypothetical protein